MVAWSMVSDNIKQTEKRLKDAGFGDMANKLIEDANAFVDQFLNNLKNLLDQSDFKLEVRFFISDDLLEKKDLDSIVAALNNAIDYLTGIGGYSEDQVKPLRDLVANFNRSKDIISFLLFDLNRVADGKIPLAYLSGMEGLNISSDIIPTECGNAGVRLVDVVYRLYQINCFVRKPGSSITVQKPPIYDNFDIKQKYAMDEITNALLILTYAASGAGTIGGFSVPEQSIQWAINIINEAIKGYFGQGRFAELFKTMRELAAKSSGYESLGTALDPSNLSTVAALRKSEWMNYLKEKERSLAK